MDNDNTEYKPLEGTRGSKVVRDSIDEYYSHKALFKERSLEERVEVHKRLAKVQTFNRYENKRADFFENTSFLWDHKDKNIRKHFTIDYLEKVLRFELYYNPTLIKSQILIYRDFLNN